MEKLTDTGVNLEKDESSVSINRHLMRDLSKTNRKYNRVYLVSIAGIIIAGIATGYLLSRISNKSISSGEKSGTSQTQSVVGSKDTKTFKDSAEGELQQGSIDGEGTHKLIRQGGESQTVYLTSSVLNLDDFIGKKVRVWGETHAAKKAAWLMDVGRVETL